MEDKPPTQAGREVPRTRTPRAAFSTPEQAAPQAKPSEGGARRAPKPPPPVTFQPPEADSTGTDKPSPTAPTAPTSSEQPATGRRRSASRNPQSQRPARTAPAKPAPGAGAGNAPTPGDGNPAAEATPAEATTPQPASAQSADEQPAAASAPTKAARNSRRQSAAKAAPAAEPAAPKEPSEQNEPAKATRPSAGPRKATRPRKAAPGSAQPVAEPDAPVQETQIPEPSAPTPPARKATRKAARPAAAKPQPEPQAEPQAESFSPTAVAAGLTPPAPADSTPGPVTNTAKAVPAAAETERVSLPREDAGQTTQPAPSQAVTTRTEAWAKLVADPGHAPELLALAAVQTIGPRAKDWAERHREVYPNASDAGLARLATNQFTRFGTVAAIFGAVAGSYAPIALLGSSALAHAELVLHLAAAHGLDPTDDARAAELLVLTRVHPTLSDAEEALATARQPAYEDAGITDAAWRFGRMAATQAGGWAALRVLNRLFPGSSLLVAATVSRNAVTALGTRATRFYSQSSQDAGNRV